MEQNPNERYLDFIREVHTKESTLMPNLPPNGLLSIGITYTDIQWAIISQEPRPIPVNPEPIAQNATNA